MLKQTSKPFADILIHYFDVCYKGATGRPLSSSMKEELENYVLQFAKAIVQEARQQCDDPPSLLERDRQQAMEYGLKHGNQAF